AYPSAPSTPLSALPTRRSSDLHIVPDSDPVTFNQAGTFYWQAVYTGDANNNGATSACQSEVLTIGPNSPSIATTLSATSGSIGDSVHAHPPPPVPTLPPMHSPT